MVKKTEVKKVEKQGDMEEIILQIVDKKRGES